MTDKNTRDTDTYKNTGILENKEVSNSRSRNKENVWLERKDTYGFEVKPMYLSVD